MGMRYSDHTPEQCVADSGWLLDFSARAAHGIPRPPGTDWEDVRQDIIVWLLDDSVGPWNRREPCKTYLLTYQSWAFITVRHWIKRQLSKEFLRASRTMTTGECDHIDTRPQTTVEDREIVERLLAAATTDLERATITLLLDGWAPFQIAASLYPELKPKNAYHRIKRCRKLLKHTLFPPPPPPDGSASGSTASS